MNLQQFAQWALAQGQVGNPNYTNSYKGQCVSLIQQLLSKVYGIPWQPRGDAKDWPTNSNVLSYFDKVLSPQDGDIGVMGSNYGDGYGHIFIYLTPTTIIEQNGRVPLHISTGLAYANPIAILRSKKKGHTMTPDSIDMVRKMETGGIPATEPELQNQDYQNNADLYIQTLWNNGGQAGQLFKADVDNLFNALGIKPTQEDYNMVGTKTWKDFVYAMVAKYQANPKPVSDIPLVQPIDQTTKDQIAETNSIVKQIFDKIKGVFK